MTSGGEKMTPCRECNSVEVKRLVATDLSGRQEVTVVCATCRRVRHKYTRGK